MHWSAVHVKKGVELVTQESHHSRRLALLKYAVLEGGGQVGGVQGCRTKLCGCPLYTQVILRSSATSSPGCCIWHGCSGVDHLQIHDDAGPVERGCWWQNGAGEFGPIASFRLALMGWLDCIRGDRRPLSAGSEEWL